MFESCYRRMNEKIKPDHDLIQKTINLASQNNKRRKLVPVIVLVTLVVILSTTAIAAKVMTGNWLGLLIDTNSPFNLNELVSKPGESIVCDDYRITLQSAVGDNTAYYILLDVDRVSGAPIYDFQLHPITERLPSNIYLSYDIRAKLDGFGCGATAYRVDDGSDPLKAKIIIRMAMNYIGKAPKRIELNITSINGIIKNGDSMDIRKIADGSWKFVISGQTNTTNVEYTFDDTKVDITPLSISMTVKIAQLDPQVRFKLEMDDGSIIDIPHIGTWTDTSLFDKKLITALFNKVIDPTRVKAIIIEGERIALQKKR